MKIEKSHKIGFFDIDHQFKLSVQSTARFFQEMAMFHTTEIGAGHDVLLKKGVIWFLYRLEIEFFRYPLMDEKINITTWSRGFKRYKGFREYFIDSSLGKIAKGSSVWLFFDLNRRRISKVRDEIARLYTFEGEKNFDKEIDDWPACGRIRPEQEMDISLRYLDFDMNGHVNNTIYLGFLETLYHRTIKKEGRSIKNIKIRFIHEIDHTKQSVRTGWQKENGVYHCNIFDDSTLYADAEIIPMD
ncbi:acyl-[acyl-carrier-protein] thioesterase [Desulfobacula sp.]